MSRKYSTVSEEKFLNEVRYLMGSEDYPYNLPKIIEKDLGKVDFDWENFSSFEDISSFDHYPLGHEEIAPGFHIFYCYAGGDWEFPVCFIFYWNNNKLRAYIPEDGNVWNKKMKSAYGNNDEDMEKDFLEEEFDYDLMKKDILKRIQPK